MRIDLKNLERRPQETPDIFLKLDYKYSKKKIQLKKKFKTS